MKSIQALYTAFPAPIQILLKELLDISDYDILDETQLFVFTQDCLSLVLHAPVVLLASDNRELVQESLRRASSLVSSLSALLSTLDTRIGSIQSPHHLTAYQSCLDNVWKYTQECIQSTKTLSIQLDSTLYSGVIDTHQKLVHALFLLIQLCSDIQETIHLTATSTSPSDDNTSSDDTSGDFRRLSLPVTQDTLTSKSQYSTLKSAKSGHTCVTFLEHPTDMDKGTNSDRKMSTDTSSFQHDLYHLEQENVSSVPTRTLLQKLLPSGHVHQSADGCLDSLAIQLPSRGGYKVEYKQAQHVHQVDIDDTIPTVECCEPDILETPTFLAPLASSLAPLPTPPASPLKKIKKRLSLLSLLDSKSSFQRSKPECRDQRSSMASLGSVSMTSLCEDRVYYVQQQEKDVLILEALENNHVTVLAGLLPNLIETFMDTSLQDPGFITVFLRNMAFFTPIDVVFERVQYSIINTLCRASSFNLLIKWIRMQYQDFEYHPRLRDQLMGLMTTLQEKGYKNEASRLKRTILTSILSISRKQSQRPSPLSLLCLDDQGTMTLNMFTRSRPSPFPLASSPNLLVTSPILDIPARDMAQYLTVADANAFLCISPYEYLYSLQQGTLQQNTTYLKLIQERSVMIQNWVAMEITSIGKLENRKKMIEKLIHVAKMCFEYHNYQTLSCLVLGLLSAPVQRLASTWKQVGQREKSTFEQLTCFISTEKHLEQYRKAVHQCIKSKQVCLPSVSILLKDIQFILEKNQDTVMTKTQQPLINIHKYRILLDVLTRFLNAARSAKYAFSERISQCIRLLPQHAIAGQLVSSVHVPDSVKPISSHVFAKYSPGTLFLSERPLSMEAVSVLLESRMAFCQDGIESELSIQQVAHGLSLRCKK